MSSFSCVSCCAGVATKCFKVSGRDWSLPFRCKHYFGKHSGLRGRGSHDLSSAPRKDKRLRPASFHPVTTARLSAVGQSLSRERLTHFVDFIEGTFPSPLLEFLFLAMF